MTKNADWRGRVWQDGMIVAAVYGTEDHVRRETGHYAFVYLQDGPVKADIKPPGGKVVEL